MAIFDVNMQLEGYVVSGINQNAGQIMQFLQIRGIERAMLYSARAACADPLSGNRMLKATLDQSQGLYGCLVAHVNRVDASLQAIKDLLSGRKFLGVSLVSDDVNRPMPPLLADEVLNACRRYQKPVFLPTPNAACVEAGLHLAKTYNMHKFVFLGMGGADWRTGIAAAQQSVNILLEISGALDRAKIPAAIEAIGSHRILFGSGMPTLDPVAAIGLISDSGITVGDQRRIMHDNMARLVALDDVESVER